MNLAEVYAWIGYDDDKINGVYDGTVPRNETTREAVRDRVDAMVAEATGKVLDIGCSGGIVAIKCARKGCDVWGIDCYQGNIEQAISMQLHESQDTMRRLRFEMAFAEDISHNDNEFDTVVMGQVLEHVISPRIVLREAIRVLKTGGKLLASVPIGYNKTALHLRFFDEEMFRKLLSEFVKVSDIRIFNKQMLAICTKE